MGPRYINYFSRLLFPKSLACLGLFTVSLSATYAQFQKAIPACTPGSIQQPWDVDLRDSMPPILDQDGIGWCYAYGSSIQLTYWAVKHQVPGVGLTEPQSFSPAAAALGYNHSLRAENRSRNNSQNREPEGGDPAQVLTQMIQRGACLGKVISSRDNFKRDLGNYEVFLNNPNAKTICAATTSLRNLFPQLQLADIEKVLREASGSSDPLEIFRDASCRNNSIHFEGAFAPKVSTLEQKDVMRNLPSLLASQIPVGVSYHSDIFDHGILESGPAGSNKEFNDNHYSVIIGMRANCKTGRRTYILRNSWGTGSCEFHRTNYNPGSRLKPSSSFIQDLNRINDLNIRCLKSCQYEFTHAKEPGAVRAKHYSSCRDHCLESESQERNSAISSTPYSCENGDFLMDEDQLARGIIDATYLQ